MSLKTAHSDAPRAYFDARAGSYWWRLDSGRFLPLDTSQTKLQFRKLGLQKDSFDQTGLNDLERALAIAQIERYVDYAAPLAGHKAGMFTTAAGLRVLCTVDSAPIFAEKMVTVHLDRFLGELLGDQVPRLLAWLKVARESLLAGDFKPGQLLALAGPSNCGKSLLQALITEWLGGRSARPYRYMVGETQFNGDLAQAEHLLLEDDNASTDIRTRRNFGARIKEFTVVKDMSIHAKGKQALTLPTFRRLSLSCNDEPENLSILPPMDVSLLDKVMLLKCSPAKLSEDRAKNWQRLAGELPGLAYQLAKWRIPEDMACPRFGVSAYQHPALLSMLMDLSPEARLLSLIDEVIFAKADGAPWTGSAEQLEKELRSSPFCFAVERLLYFSTACGVYLERLRKTDRVDYRTLQGRKVWTILAAK